MKKCGRCKQHLDLSFFSKDTKTKSGYANKCKPCAAFVYSKWRKANLTEQRKKERTSHYIRNYGLTKEQAEQLVADRNGVCSICSLFLPLVVDHCHQTGKVRGLICSACNSMLGYAKDNGKTLENAILYLKDFYEKD